MTRRSKREIERAIEDIGAESIDDDGFSVVFEDTATAEWYEAPDFAGEPLDEDAVDPTVVWRDEVVETDWEPTEDPEADPR